MKSQTTRFILNIATAIALAMTAAVVLVPTAASAGVAATVTTNANVRSGPGTSYPVLYTVRSGQTVDVEDCGDGWCLLSRGGYVSASLLTTGSGSGGGSGAASSPGFSIGIGPGGVQIGIGNNPGGGGPIYIDPDDEGYGEVCFYDRTRGRGASFCMEEGDSVRNLQFTGWNDRIRSFDNPDRLRVTVCYDSEYRNCRTYRSSASSLDDFDRQISSIRVR